MTASDESGKRFATRAAQVLKSRITFGTKEKGLEETSAVG
jgi:hypothetical protein